MGLKLLIGQTINGGVEKLVGLNYRLVPFLPNGRILELDLKRANFNPQYIFDVGANVGQTGNGYSKHFPNAQVFCFEPVKAVYDQAVANTSHNPKIKCFNLALGDQAGHAEIYKSNSYNGIGSLNGAENPDLSETESIEITTGQDFCKQHDILAVDLLKVDTEGYEIPVLRGFGPMLKQVKFIYAETGFEKGDPCKTHISELIEFLSGYGFIVSGFYDQFRLGRSKLKLSHCDVLFTNAALIDTY